MTPEEARELLKGTTPGPWEADSYTYQLAGCPEATDFWVSSESSFIAQNDNLIGDERVSAAGNNFDLIAAAPDLAEIVAGMQAEYAVQVQSSGEWYYLNEHGDWTIIPHLARWFWSSQDAHALIPYSQKERFRIVRRYVTDAEGVEES